MSREIPVVISGLGHCSALGQGLGFLRQAGWDGLTPKPTIESVATAGGPVAVAVLRAPEIVVPKLLPEAVERRMSRFAKIFMATAAEALADAEPNDNLDPTRTGLVIGTAFGNLNLACNYQRRVFRDGPAGASPSLFAASIHNSLAAQLTLTFDLRGPNSTVSTMEQTTVGAMRLAYDWIQQGIVDRVVVAIGDELSDYHLYYSAHQTCEHPPGEGVMSFVLAREDRAPKKYARVEAPQLVYEKPSTPVEIAPPRPALYGSMITGGAFALALAALDVERDGRTRVCVQDGNGLPDQAIVLTSCRDIP